MNSELRSQSYPSRGDRPKGARRVLRRTAVLAVAIGAAGLLACTDEGPVDRRQDRVVGHIGEAGFSDPEYRPRIPETATAGVPLEIRFWTWGGGCLHEGDTESVVSGRSVEVTPYDLLTWGTDLVCTADFRYLDHTARVVFDDPGTSEIVLRYSTGSGWRPRDFDGAGRKVFTVEVAEAG